MLNLARIDELKSEVGEDDFAEVVGLFCEEVEEVLDELTTIAKDTLPQKLHFLKGSALNIGMDHVGELCRVEELRLLSEPTATPDTDAIRTAYMASKAKLTG